PAAVHFAELVLVLMLALRWKNFAAGASRHIQIEDPEQHPDGSKFLRLAWLANPFAYIAMNTAIPLIPDLAARLDLSPKLAGFFCSIWFFSRMITFGVLAVWERWHYRFVY